MPIDDFFRYLSDLAYFVLFVATLADSVRHPRRVTIDAALFFGVLAGVIAASLLLRQTVTPPLVTSLLVALVMTLPYLLVRLADDFAGVPRAALAGSIAGLVPIVVLAFVVRQPYPTWYTLLLVVYFGVLTAYATARFLSESRLVQGITRRRMQAVATGSGFLTLAILFSGMKALFPAVAATWDTGSAIAGLGCGVSFFLGFSPPSPLRRLWQEGDLRAFFELTTTLPASLPLEETLPELNRAAASAVGARNAMTVLWRDGESRPEVPGLPEELIPEPSAQPTLARRVFESQQAVFVEDAMKVDPDNADRYRQFGARGLLIAPVTGQGRRWGVLSAFSERPSVFAHNEVELLRSFAGAIAAFLARSELVQRDVENRAEADALRLKDDFLSAAAHDLRTPLTVLLGEAQLMRRRLRTDRSDPALDLAATEAILGSGRRMQRLANGLLDVARIEAGQLVLERAPLDLTALAARVAATLESSSHHVVVEGPPVVAWVDGERIRQVIENLVENAIKFSPEADEVEVRLWIDGDEAEAPSGRVAQIAVRDIGIGIPAEELQVIFERFQRGAETNGRFRGSGVGLYLCKRIVEEHQGRIWAESELGTYTELRLSLPLLEVEGTSEAR